MPGFEEEGASFKGPDGVGADATAKRQGGPELWAKLDAFEVLEQLEYPETPVIRQLDFGS